MVRKSSLRMRELTFRDDDEVGGEEVEGAGRVSELSGVPALEVVFVGAGGDEAGVGIDGADGVAGGEGDGGHLPLRRIADLVVAPELVAELPEKAAGVVAEVGVDVADPLAGVLRACRCRG